METEFISGDLPTRKRNATAMDIHKQTVEALTHVLQAIADLGEMPLKGVIFAVIHDEDKLTVCTGGNAYDCLMATIDYLERYTQYET